MNKNYKKIGLFLGLVLLAIVLSNPLIIPIPAEDDIPIVYYPNPQPGTTFPACCKRGDLIFMDNSSITVWTIYNYPSEGIISNDHVVLFVGTNPHNSTGSDWCFHAGAPVQYTRLYKFTHDGYHTNFSVWRVRNASVTQINNVIAWAEQWEGKPYQFAIPFGAEKHWNNFDLLLPVTRHMWYCSELVWAAYYAVTGIDIDCNGFSPYPYGNQGPCVNMGFPKTWDTDQYYHNITHDPNTAVFDYTKRCEIKMDGDMKEIYHPLIQEPAIAYKD